MLTTAQAWDILARVPDPEIPAISGLISGIVGALVVAPLSGSALMVSGPAAAMLPLIAHGLERVGGLPGLLTATSLSCQRPLVLAGTKMT